MRVEQKDKIIKECTDRFVKYKNYENDIMRFNSLRLKIIDRIETLKSFKLELNMQSTILAVTEKIQSYALIIDIDEAQSTIKHIISVYDLILLYDSITEIEIVQMGTNIE